MKKIVLASGSPRRKELLKSIGLKFSVLLTDTDESNISKELPPELYVKELAILKANSAAKKAGRHALVIGADTVVYHNGSILGKPSDEQNACDMLKSLSDGVHSVYTGIAVLDTDTMKIVAQYERTNVSFRRLTDREIENYVKKYKPTDKAGAYGIQEFAAVFSDRIEGDYYNIVGLPLCKLYTLIVNEFGEELF